MQNRSTFASRFISLCVGLMTVVFIGIPAAVLVKLFLAPPVEIQDRIGSLIAFGSFGPVGGLLVALLLHVRRSKRAEAKLEARHPTEPWKHRTDWVKSAAKPATLGRSVAWTAIALSTLSFTFGIAALVILDQPAGDGAPQIPLLLIVAGFCMLALGILGNALLHIRTALTCRGVSCHLVAPPFVPGDAVRCTVHWQLDALPSEKFVVELECSSVAHVNTPIYSDEPSSYSHLHYQSRYSISSTDCFRSRDGLEMPIRFRLPRRAYESSSNDSIEWTLKILWKNSLGLKQIIDFEIPVFNHPDASQTTEAMQFDGADDYQTSSGIPARACAETLPELVEWHEGKILECGGDRTSISLPLVDLPRFVTCAMNFVALVVLCSGSYLVGTVFGPVFGVVGACLPLLLCLRFGKQNLGADPNGVTYNAVWSGVAKNKMIPWADIEGFSYQQTKNASWGIGMHQVVAMQRDGHKTPLLQNVFSRVLARTLCKQLELQQQAALQSDI